MSKKLTLTEINNRLKDSFNQNVVALEYVNKRSPIKLKCLDCGYEWQAPSSTVLYGEHHKCPNCGIVKQVVLHCAYCGKEFSRPPSDLTKNKSGYFYCSRECGNRHKNQLRLESGEWDKSLNYRLKAMMNLPHKCAVCGWNEDERILEVHHKDENREHNELNNLAILCPICHRKITLGYYKLTDDYQLISVKD